MASRWPLLIQTLLSGEIRSWRCLPSPWLVSRATRRITILYLDIKHTSKFFFPWCVIFPCNNHNALFYLLKCVPLLQFYNSSARIAKPVCYLAFFFWDYSRYVIKLKHNISRLQPDQHRRAFIDSALNWEVFHWTKQTLWFFVIKKFCHSSLNRPLSILIACLVYS